MLQLPPDLAWCDGRQTTADSVALVERLCEPAVVYDLQVADNHNFFAGGVLVHNCLIVDDPVKNAEEAASETYRERAWEWWLSTAYTRLEPGGGAILVQTRWHEDDLAGRLIAQSDAGVEHWEVLRLPAIAEEDDPIGRAEGEALWPQRYDLAALEQIRASVGPYVWSALYQQRPQPREGNLIKRGWFHIEDAAPEGLRWVRCWDLAASEKTTADYTAGVRAARDAEGRLWLADMVRGRWAWPDARRIILQTMALEPGVPVGVEATGFQLAAFQDLMRQPEAFNRSVRPLHVDRDKVSRAQPWIARAQAGLVTLVRGAWVPEFLAEATSFPTGRHDDMVDAVSAAVAMLGAGRPADARTLAGSVPKGAQSGSSVASSASSGQGRSAILVPRRG